MNFGLNFFYNRSRIILFCLFGWRNFWRWYDFLW